MPKSRFVRVFAWIVCAAVAATLMLAAAGGASAGASRQPSGGKAVAGGKLGKTSRRQDADQPGEDTPYGSGVTDPNAHFGW